MKDYWISEEEYLEYYQNSSDPTFVNYPFPEKVDSEINEELNWDEIPEDLDIFLNGSSA
jgi:hypothetical protein